MNAEYFVYKNDTGKVLRTGWCPASMVDIQARDGETAVQGAADAATQYVNDGELVPRPWMLVERPSSGVVDEPIVFNGVPAGALIRYPGGSELMDGSGILEWQTEVPGVFEFAFELFPYLPLEVSVEVADA